MSSLLLGLAAISPTCFANLSVAPQIIESEVRPGVPGAFKIDVGNSSETQLDCSVAVSSLAVTSNGFPMRVEKAERSCQSWVAVDPVAFRLEPRTRKEISLSARVPSDASGGYYCLLTIDANPPKQTDDQQTGGVSGAISFSFRSSVVVLLVVPTGRLKSALKPGDLTFNQISDSGAYEMRLPIRNVGNIHARVVGSVQVRSEDGQAVREVPFAAGRGIILPDNERIFVNKSDIVLPDGIYLARIRLEEAHSKRRVQHDYPFHVRDGVPSIAPLTDDIRQLLLRHTLGFAVSTTQVAVEAKPGARKTQAVQLINMTKEKIPIKAVYSNWVRNASGEDLVTILDSTPTESLLSLRQSEFELPPLGKRQVPLVVALPKDKVGETFAAVTFNRPDRPLGNTPHECARRSVLVRMIPSGTLSPAGEITALTSSRRPTGVLDFKTSIKNTGNSSWEPEIILDIMGKNGQSAGRVYGKSEQMFRILPGGSANFTLSYDQILEAGTYTAQLMLRFDPNKPAITKDAKFEVPPFQGITTAAAGQPASATGTTAAAPPQSANPTH